MTYIFDRRPGDFWKDGLILFIRAFCLKLLVRTEDIWMVFEIALAKLARFKHWVAMWICDGSEAMAILIVEPTEPPTLGIRMVKTQFLRGKRERVCLIPESHMHHKCSQFLDACTRLYKSLCRLVGPSVGSSVRPSVHHAVGCSTFYLGLSIFLMFWTCFGMFLRHFWHFKQVLQVL